MGFNEKNNKIFLLIIAIFVFHLVNNLIILNQNSVPLFFDGGEFYNSSVRYYRYLFSSPSLGKFFRHFYSLSPFYPPFTFLLQGLLYNIWGVSQKTAVLANTFYLLVFIYFIFLIGKYLYDVKTGLLAALLVSFFPGVYGFSRTNFLTLPKCAIVAISFYLLLRTENFLRRGFSILFGITLGIGLLIKWIYLIYILPPLLICFFSIFKKGKEIKFTTAFFNLLLGLGLGALIALPWYLPNLKNLIPMLLSTAYGTPNWENFLNFLKINPFNLRLFSFIATMEKYHLYTYYTFLFFILFFAYLFSKNQRGKWILLVSFFVPLLTFTLIIIEHYLSPLCPRYLIPLYSYVALIMAKGLREIKHRSLRRGFIFSILLFGLLQFYRSYYLSGYEHNLYTKADLELYLNSGFLYPKTVNWKIQDMLNIFRKERQSFFSKILILPFSPLTSTLSIHLGLRQDYKHIFPLSPTFEGTAYGIVSLELYDSLIENADFVVDQEGGIFNYDDSPWIKEVADLLRQKFSSQKKDFSLLKELSVDIDDKNTKILIYQRKMPLSPAVCLSLPGLETEGIDLDAIDFIQGNLVYEQNSGMVIDSGIQPAYAVYEINLTKSGIYELWVHYAAGSPRPVDIYFDGILKKSMALRNTTSGWSYCEAQWSKELEIKAKRGRHRIKFLATHNMFPHLDALKLVYKPD